MRWTIVAVLGIVIGLCLIRGGLDALLEWRAWFLGLSGLVFFIFGVLGVFLQVRRLGRNSETGDSERGGG